MEIWTKIGRHKSPELLHLVFSIALFTVYVLLCALPYILAQLLFLVTYGSDDVKYMETLQENTGACLVARWQAIVALR